MKVQNQANRRSTNNERKRAKQKAIDTFFFRCERIYTVKGKKQRMAFYLLASATRLVLRELIAFSLLLFIIKFYSFKNQQINL